MVRKFGSKKLGQMLDEDPTQFPVQHYPVLAGKTLYKINEDTWSALVVIERDDGSHELRLYKWKWDYNEECWKTPYKYKVDKKDDFETIISALVEFGGKDTVKSLIDVDNMLSQTISRLRKKLIQKEKEKKALAEKRAKELIEERKNNTDTMEEKVDEFRDMVENSDTSENDLQDFLEENYWFFGSDYLKALGEERAGMKGRVDFLLERNDTYHDIVEVKLPTVTLFNDDESMSGDFKNALSQIARYLDYYSKHYLSYKEQTGKDVDQPRGIIVIGRDNEDSKSLLKRHRRVIRDNIKILTFDDLIDKAETTIDNVRSYEQ